MPESGRRLAEDAAGQVRTEPSGRELNTAFAARSTTAAAPSFGEHSIHRCSGSHTTREASTSSAVTSLRNIASGLRMPLRRLHDDLRKMILVQARFCRSRCARQGEVRRRRCETGLRDGSKNDDRTTPFGIFSMPNTSAESYWPAVERARCEGRKAVLPLAEPASTSTIWMPVNASAPSNLADEERRRAMRAAERSRELRVPRFGERLVNRVHAHLGRGGAFEPAVKNAVRRRRRHAPSPPRREALR